MCIRTKFNDNKIIIICANIQEFYNIGRVAYYEKYFVRV